MQQATVERRTRRVPLSVMIELEHENFPRPLEADGVNLGLGGLALEAPYLPAVGDKMRCRFASPGSGPRVEADCEVVWAEDRGPRVGQFGLRFRDLDSASAEAILNIVRRPEGIGQAIREATEATTVPGTLAAPVAEEGADEAEEDHAGHPVTLYLDGMPTPAVARVQQQLPGGVRLEQELGFLKIGTGLEVKNGCRRRGRIASLDLRIDDAMPKLVLEIAYESNSLDTIPDLAPPVATDVEISADVWADENAADDLGPSSNQHVEAPPWTSAPVLDFDEPESALHAAAAAEAERLAGADARSLESHDRLVSAPSTRAPEGPAVVMSAPMHQVSLATIGSRLASASRAFRVAWAGWMVSTRSAVARIRLLAVELRQRYAPRRDGRKTSTARVTARFVSLLRSRIGARVSTLRGRPAPRRTTAPPPGVSKNASRKGPSAVAETSSWAEKGRVLVLALFAFGGAAAAVYALSPSHADDDLPPVASAAAPAPATPVVDAPSVEPTLPVDALPPAPAPAPRVETKHPENLSDAVRPAAPGHVPPDSPYATDAREPTKTGESVASEGATFGDERVPNGRSHLLRMSQPVTTIRGTADERGFTIVVPDSLSLDRAGPIATDHPEVERAMILNRGDHAELVIRFVAGKRPPYRVAARGRAIEVTIGKN